MKVPCWVLIAFHCIWAMVHNGNICAISGVTWLGIFWGDGVCTFHTWDDSMRSAFGIMYAV